MRRRMASVATDITSKITLNDGVSMPLFGLGVWRATPGPGGQTEQAVEFALQKGYRMIDTAEMYENEADVGRELKKSGLNREDVFIVTKLSENGYDRCKKIFKESLEKLDVPCIDLYLVHSPKSGKIIETYKAMLELKEQGLIRSVGVSNFGIQHLEGIKSHGLPVPSVNQIELHPWQQKPDIVKYCRDNNIAVMGYAPLVKGQRFDDETLCEIAKRNNKSPAQVLIRWSLQHGFITIPKSVHSDRIEENMLVFDWSLNAEDMTILDDSPDKSCKPWNPCDVPWTG
ncbi:glyoxal reductase-like [Mytilus trossulus]|uniref:glyoxal reductase-like n=1 Tax=Mytilus trossulus TaxID=6551 RepID=UPI0030069737